MSCIKIALSAVLSSKILENEGMVKNEEAVFYNLSVDFKALNGWKGFARFRSLEMVGKICIKVFAEKLYLSFV